MVSLDGLAGEPLDILINGYLIAQGEVVVVSDKFGIRITDIITPSERMHRLSRLMNATDSLPATGSMLMTVTGALALIILLMVVMAWAARRSGLARRLNDAQAT